MHNKNKQPIKGIWCRTDNQFYYFDSGIHSTNSGPQRVISALTQRGLIEFDPSGRTGYGQEPYRVMTLAEAEERGYEVNRLSINKPTEVKADTKGKQNLWKK